MKIFASIILILFSCLNYAQEKNKPVLSPPLKSSNPAVNDSVKGENHVYNAGEVEVLPEFPGGVISLCERFRRKLESLKERDSLTGRIYVSFIIEKNGSLSNVKVVRDPSGRLGKMVPDFLNSSPKWQPGKIGGKAVRTMYNLPLLLTYKKSLNDKPQETIYPLEEKVVSVSDHKSVAIDADYNVAVPNFDEREKKDDTNKIYIMPDLELGPKFPGGNDKFIKYYEDNFNKDAVAKSGWISFDFIVEKDGSVTFKPLRSPAKDIEEEATRVLNKMPKWTPGKRNGQPVRSTFTQLFTIRKS